VEPQLQNGNRILERSDVTMSDGRTLEMADVYFETDAAETVRAQTDVAQAAPVPPSARHQASITVRSLLNARDPNVAPVAASLVAQVTRLGSPTPTASAAGPAPVRHASATSGRMKRPVEASPTPTPQRVLPDLALKQPWDPASAVPSPEPLTDPSTPVIDWSRRRAPLIERFPEIPVHAPWAVDFLGVNKNPQRDLGSLTGLRMRIPEPPNRADSI
jgi:hypothetical protein